MMSKYTVGYSITNLAVGKHIIRICVKRYAIPQYQYLHPAFVGSTMPNSRLQGRFHPWKCLYRRIKLADFTEYKNYSQGFALGVTDDKITELGFWHRMWRVLTYASSAFIIANGELAP